MQEIKDFSPDKIYMGFPEELPPHYAYEAVQIFNDCGAFPTFVPFSSTESTDCSGIWLQKGDERRNIPYFAEKNEKTEHKRQKREIISKKSPRPLDKWARLCYNL